MSEIGSRNRPYDAIVIGSGFGGCMVSMPLMEAGFRVLMLERGDRVERSELNWGDEGAFVLTPHYSFESLYSVRTRLGPRAQGICACVGGPSVFYGGTAFRFRESDFEVHPEIVGDSSAAWPLTYEEMEPHYGRAEALLGVAGCANVDPTEPYRSTPYPEPPAALAEPSRRMAAAAESLGMHPFRIPMAINGSTCVSCTTCDAFACAVGAKNDLATRVVPRLEASGLALRPGTVVVGLRHHAGRIVGVDAIDRATGQRLAFEAERVILAAGALATPHLLAASGVRPLNPAGDLVGRYLMRHCNAMVYGYFPEMPNPDGLHHKQIAIQDFYFGDRAAPRLGKLGNIQQVMAPPASLVRAMLPRAVGTLATGFLRNLTGLLVIAEDQPRPENRVEVDPRVVDRFGLPAVRIRHRYTRRDQAARAALLRRAREVLRRAGGRFTVTWKVTTFSHAVGTVRMGEDHRTAPLDRDCRFRGVENLWVTDGSVFPTSAGVNPSLTIAANALRVGESIAEAA